VLTDANGSKQVIQTFPSMTTTPLLSASTKKVLFSDTTFDSFQNVRTPTPNLKQAVALVATGVTVFQSRGRDECELDEGRIVTI
jgi:hypothetical protein